MKILAVESSCDETSAAVVEDGRKVLSCKINSQIEIHKRYGGVVPEIASRAHMEAVSSLTREALFESNLTMDDIDALAVTYRPGLIGALLVGVNFTKSLAYATGKPLIGVNHIRGHVAANYIAHPDLKPPFLALVISGGHTSLINVKSYTDYETIGVTRDDAAGEAFDKVARVMGIPYPGGATMDALAKEGDGNAIPFPRAVVKDEPFNFSYSGLKTAVINYLHREEQACREINRESVAASFTKAVCETVWDRLDKAMNAYNYGKIVLAGGVSANSHIRATVEALAKKHNAKAYMPPLSLCGDNGAMIASQAFFEAEVGNYAGIDLNAVPTGDKFVN